MGVDNINEFDANEIFSMVAMVAFCKFDAHRANLTISVWFRGWRSWASSSRSRRTAFLASSLLWLLRL